MGKIFEEGYNRTQDRGRVNRLKSTAISWRLVYEGEIAKNASQGTTIYAFNN